VSPKLSRKMVSLVTYLAHPSSQKKFKTSSCTQRKLKTLGLPPRTNEKRCPFGSLCAPLISLGVRNRKSLDDHSLIFWTRHMAKNTHTRFTGTHALLTIFMLASPAADAATRFCFAARASHGKWRARGRSLQLAACRQVR